jgi:hypothetical protein
LAKFSSASFLSGDCSVVSTSKKEQKAAKKLTLHLLKKSEKYKKKKNLSRVFWSALMLLFMTETF